MTTSSSISARLAHWFERIDAEFLSRQKPPAMLLPASTAVTVHGDYSHAWVRDNVYSILGPWALSRAFRRHVGDCEQTRRLEASVVALMRGLLHAMARQAEKIEAFKRTEDPLDSLHAKFDAETGETVVGDDGWGHLQLDATALFLLQLAQMTCAGLAIVHTRDEACVVQNLIHYIGPTYRVPDYGIWERGHKTNTGRREVNASSVGMAKAALEAMDGLTISLPGGDRFVFRSAPDEIVRSRETLLALLPAESASKESDSALLAIVGYPAYAVEDARLVQRTRARVLNRLEGRYGCKRFLRDGHQTAVEDTTRLHYEVGELSRFENIEAEWPLFWTYLAVDAAVQDDPETCQRYLAKLEGVAVERNGRLLIPELYSVPVECVALEVEAPGSQARLPNENTPLYWAQSLWVVATLLREGLVLPEDIDPLQRRVRLGARVGSSVDIVIVGDAAKERYKGRAFGALVSALQPATRAVRLLPSPSLATSLAELGACPNLGLTGRPPRRLGAVITSRLYQQGGTAIAFTPTSLDSSRSYLRFDAAAFAERIRADIAYIARHWSDEEAPVIVAPIPDEALADPGADAVDSLVEACAAGRVGSAIVRLVALDEIARRPQRSIDDLAHLREPVRAPSQDIVVNPVFQRRDVGFGPVDIGDNPEEWAGRLALSVDPYEMAYLIKRLLDAQMAECVIDGRGRVEDLAIGLYDAAGRRQDWALVRTMAYIVDLVDERLSDMQKELVVRMMRIQVGNPGDAGAIIEGPLAGEALRKRLAGLADGSPLRAVLAEETLLHLGAAIKADPSQFSGCRTVRLADWLHLIDREAAPRDVVAMAPSDVAAIIRQCLTTTPSVRSVLAQGEAQFRASETQWCWRSWRARVGVLTRVNEDFFDRVWSLLGRCRGLVIGNPDLPGSRIDAAITRSDHTGRERQFATLIEDALSRILEPEYRTLMLEAINAAASACEADIAFGFSGDLVLDDVVRAAHADVEEDRAGVERLYAASAWHVGDALGHGLSVLAGL